MTINQQFRAAVVWARQRLIRFPGDPDYVGSKPKPEPKERLSLVDQAKACGLTLDELVEKRKRRREKRKNINKKLASNSDKCSFPDV